MYYFSSFGFQIQDGLASGLGPSVTTEILLPGDFDSFCFCECLEKSYQLGILESKVLL